MIDIYFDAEYGKACEDVDGGSFCEFILQDIAGTVCNHFIKRKAPFLVDGIQYYDIVTPYGYGGPIIECASDKETLLKLYEKEFYKFCQENHIVCEFVRFHPIYRNYEDFSEVYETSFSRHTVGTNLADFEDPVQAEFSKTARREVKKAEAAGISYIPNLNPENLDRFRALYEETMERNHASSMYYFSDAYYNMLRTKLRHYVLEMQAIWEGQVIASELYFLSAGLMHAHLLGSSKTFLNLGGGSAMEAAAARWGKQHGYNFIHHGGGRSSEPTDPLYMYKKKFGKHTEFDFYIGKKIWNPTVYDALVAKRMENSDFCNSNYFPLYRG